MSYTRPRSTPQDLEAVRAARTEPILNGRTMRDQHRNVVVFKPRHMSCEQLDEGYANLLGQTAVRGWLRHRRPHKQPARLSAIS